LRVAQEKKETRRASGENTDSHVSRKALANAQLADPKSSSSGEFEEVIMIEVVTEKAQFLEAPVKRLWRGHFDE
jgi:hypothetical protein